MGRFSGRFGCLVSSRVDDTLAERCRVMVEKSVDGRKIQVRVWIQEREGGRVHPSRKKA